MYRLISVALVVLLYSSCLVNGGKVLVFPVDGSHWVNMKILIEELHLRGHEITVIRPSDSWYITAESPHYKSITVPPAGYDKKYFGSSVTTTLNLRREGASLWNHLSQEYVHVERLYQIHKAQVKIVGEIFEDAKMMQSLHDAKYDLLLTDPFGAGVLLGHRLGLPLVFNVRWTVQGEGHQAIAPSPLSYIPITRTELTDKMTFPERVKNFLHGIFYERFRIWYAIDRNYNPLVHRYFGSNVHYMELFQAADIWLMRNDFTFEFPRPTMPNVVYMSGFQCKPSKPLSKELEDFVQSSGEHGVIVMTLGTLVANLPEVIAEDIAAAFAQLPQKVIWRYKGKAPSTLGNNTLLLDWLPQNDLLGHPKTRVFVAHGGDNGMQEAIYHGVPLVGLPLMFDQPDNFIRMKARGVAKVLDIATVNKDNFLQALKDVLYDPTYREKMKVLSNLHRDQPMKPLDLAMFWIEFVMRHKGAAHLRTESYKMSMIEYHSIDVMMFLMAVILLVITVFIYMVKFLWQRVFAGSKVKKE